MKKLSMISLAVAAALAICPAALVAQPDFNFTYTSSTSNTLDASGWLGTSGTANGGDIVTQGYVNFEGNTYSLVANPNPGFVTNPSANGAFYYDNLIFPDPAEVLSGNVVDGAGLLFGQNINDPTLEINIYGNGSVSIYSLDTGYAQGNLPVQNTGTFTLITSVPEGGAALLYLLLAGGACFGAMFFSRNRFANLVSA